MSETSPTADGARVSETPSIPDDDPESDEPPIRVCLLTPGDTLPAWAAVAVERLVAETNAEITLVVADSSTSTRSTTDALRRVVELREWGVVAAAIEVFGENLEQTEPVPVRAVEGVDAPDWLSCEPIPVDGWKHRLPASVVDRMADVDVAVRFGFGFLVGDALTAPEAGVLSFHHGDFREYRGQPMGFWEFVHGRQTAGVTLQRINETLDGGQVVVALNVDIADALTWSGVRSRLFEASSGMLAEGVRRLERDDYEPETLESDELGTLYTHPRGRAVLTYLYRTCCGGLRRLVGTNTTDRDPKLEFRDPNP